MKCIHFSDDMVFLLALVIFQFFSDENQDIYFSISKKKRKKKKIPPPRHLKKKILMRTKTFIFRGLMCPGVIYVSVQVELDCASSAVHTSCRYGLLLSSSSILPSLMSISVPLVSVKYNLMFIIIMHNLII